MVALHLTEARWDWNEDPRCIEIERRSPLRGQSPSVVTGTAVGTSRKSMVRSVGREVAAVLAPGEPPYHVWHDELPFSDQSIGGCAAMEGAGQRAIGIDPIGRRDAAKHRDVQVRVLRLQRIECPLDEVDSRRDGAFALRDLQSFAKRGATRVGMHAKHVRPLHGAPVTRAGHRPHEPNKPVLVIGADQDPAPLHRGAEQRRRYDLAVLPPDGYLHVNDVATARQVGHIPELNRRPPHCLIHSLPHCLIASLPNC